jgi:hypothetical protein
MLTNKRSRSTSSRRFVPYLEVLEGRTLPSTFTVLNLVDSGAGSLRQAILDANASTGADVIDFAKNVKGTIPLTSGELAITSDLTIDGPGADKLTVSGNDTSRVFNVDGGSDDSARITVSISGLTVAHGRAPTAAGVRNHFFSDLTLSDLVLTENGAVGLPGADLQPNGGAVQNSGTGAVVRLARCRVAGNTVLADPNGLQPSSGGGLSNFGGGTAFVTDSTISGNEVFSAVGAGGGAILSTDGSLAISNSLVADNTAAGVAPGAPAYGGGIEVIQGNGLTLSNSRIVGNRAVGGDGAIGYGGGISVFAATAVIRDSTISGNECRAGDIQGPEFGAFAGGGGVGIESGELTVDGSTITGNRSVAGASLGKFGGFGTGGGIDMDRSTSVITGSSITDNEAVGGASLLEGIGDGGGIRIRLGTATVSDCTISDNRATGGAGGGLANGGGILVTVSSSLFLNNSRLSDNQAKSGDSSDHPAGYGAGGAIALYYDSSASIVGSTLQNNSAVGGNTGGVAFGGAIASFFGSSVSVSDSALTTNRALAGSGGTFVGLNASLATAFGGAIYNEFRLDIDRSILGGNQAIGGNNAVTHQAPDDAEAGGANGGAIYNNIGGQVSIRDSIIERNQAIGGNGNSADGPTAFAGTGIGGGISNQFDGGTFGLGSTQVTVSDSTIQDNDAIGGNGNQGSGDAAFVGAGLGGGIANSFGGVVDVDGSSVLRNRATAGERNTASGSQVPASLGAGGAIFNALGNVVYFGETLAPSTVTISNSTLEHNQARGGRDAAGNGGDGWGGAIASLFSAAANVTGSTVADNLAIGGAGGNGYGGGAFNDATSSFALSTSVVTGNHANGGEGIGGGVYNLGNLDVDGLTLLLENHASTSHDDLFDPLA